MNHRPSPPTGYSNYNVWKRTRAPPHRASQSHIIDTDPTAVESPLVELSSDASPPWARLDHRNLVYLQPKVAQPLPTKALTPTSVTTPPGEDGETTEAVSQHHRSILAAPPKRTHNDHRSGLTKLEHHCSHILSKTHQIGTETFRNQIETVCNQQQESGSHPSPEANTTPIDAAPHSDTAPNCTDFEHRSHILSKTHQIGTETFRNQIETVCNQQQESGSHPSPEANTTPIDAAQHSDTVPNCTEFEHRTQTSKTAASTAPYAESVNSAHTDTTTPKVVLLCRDSQIQHSCSHADTTPPKSVLFRCSSQIKVQTSYSRAARLDTSLIEN